MNNQLRDHVTSGAFLLSLRKTHIAALVYIDHELRHNQTLNEKFAGGTLVSGRLPATRVWSLFATGSRGLQDRGLIQRLPGANDRGAADRRPDDIWQITTAGEHVIGLLKEAGLWDEYTAELPEVKS